MLAANFSGAGKTRNKAVVPNTYCTSGGVILRLGVENVANVARAKLDQSCTALCALLVKVHQVIANMIVVGLLDGHWQHYETISQLHIADFKRLI